MQNPFFPPIDISRSDICPSGGLPGLPQRSPDIVGNPAVQRVAFGGSAGGLKEGIRPAEGEPRPHSGLRTKHTVLQAGLRRLVLYPRRVPFLGEAIPGLPLVKLALGGPN